MSRFECVLRRIPLVLLLAARIATCASSAPSEFPVQPITVKLFNDAGVGNNVLRFAEQDAARILRTASVEMEWLPCRPIDRSNMAVCKAPPGALEMHILPDPLTADFHKDTLGIAMLEEGAGNHAAVFLSRAREAAARSAGEIDVALVLGCAMAHEIGHLLLRSSAHSREGVMRSDFQTEDFRKAVQHLLTFTSAQRDLIQKHRRGSAL